MATIFFNHAEPGKAVKALELAQQITPSLSFHALNVKGAAQLTLGDSKGAQASFAESAGKRNHPETYNNWGILWILQRDGDHAGAIDRSIRCRDPAAPDVCSAFLQCRVFAGEPEAHFAGGGPLREGHQTRCGLRPSTCQPAARAGWRGQGALAEGTGSRAREQRGRLDCHSNGVHCQARAAGWRWWQWLGSGVSG